MVVSADTLKMAVWDGGEALLDRKTCLRVKARTRDLQTTKKKTVATQ
jgi:hypothetical protein